MRNTSIQQHERRKDPAERHSSDAEGSGTAQGENVVTLAAELLHRKGLPDAGAQLMREHAADGSGHCRGCPHSGAPAPLYPCLLRAVGEAVERLAHEVAGRGTAA